MPDQPETESDRGLAVLRFCPTRERSPEIADVQNSDLRSRDTFSRSTVAATARRDKRPRRTRSSDPRDPSCSGYARRQRRDERPRRTRRFTTRPSRLGRSLNERGRATSAEIAGERGGPTTRPSRLAAVHPTHMAGQTSAEIAENAEVHYTTLSAWAFSQHTCRATSAEIAEVRRHDLSAWAFTQRTWQSNIRGDRGRTRSSRSTGLFLRGVHAPPGSAG